MLTYAFQELKQNNYEEIAGEDFETIHDLFAEILIRGLSAQLKQGLRKEYVSYHDSLSTLRGKLDVNETMRNLMRKKQKMACEYDELSENNSLNQILKTTALFLLGHPHVKRNRRMALKRLMLFFTHVEEVEVTTIRWDSLRFDRNSKGSRLLIYICYFVLDNMLMTTESGSFMMKGFSDEHMCRLYEKFVLEYYRVHHPTLKARAAQIEWNINKEESTSNILPTMRTDILLTLKERTLIIDTKYYSRLMQSNFDKQSVHSNNLYQIHSYVMNYDVNHTGKIDGMLLYAKTEEDVAFYGQAKMNDGNVLYFRTLDLNRDFNDITNQLDGFLTELQKS
jgi:5-methylcytosine-specific restriction enzyme subunit McrC